MTAIIVPPYVASPDNIRCGQSVVLMILKHFRPEKEWTFADVDKMAAYVEGKWTWSEASAVSLAEMGFDVVCYTDFDFQRFIDTPETYFIEKQGKEHGEITYKHIDLPSSVDICKRYVASSNIQTFTNGWTIADAMSLLADDYLLMCWTNSRKLYHRQSRDAGHLVLVFHINTDHGLVLFHDPGAHSSLLNGLQVNANKNSCLGVEHFFEAAKEGGENGSSLTAVRLRRK